MTDSVPAILNEIAAKRAGFKDFVRAVDEDLSREREARLAQGRTDIATLIVQAFAKGASIADLKRAYGTRDYRTIRNILDARMDEVEALRNPVEVKPEQFDVAVYNSETETLTFRKNGQELQFDITPLDDDGYLLSWSGGSGRMGALLDGEILTPSEVDADRAAMYKAIAG